jgi:hypothetical protein
MIEDESEEKDTERLIYLYTTFQSLPFPVYYVAGNHDAIYISEEKMTKLLYLPQLYYTFEAGDYHCIVLHSKAIQHQNASLSEEQQQRLQRELATTEKQCLIFIHH